MISSEMANDVLAWRAVHGLCAVGPGDVGWLRISSIHSLVLRMTADGLHRSSFPAVQKSRTITSGNIALVNLTASFGSRRRGLQEGSVSYSLQGFEFITKREQKEVRCASSESTVQVLSRQCKSTVQCEF
jgi:hypothetical protein